MTKLEEVLQNNTVLNLSLIKERIQELIEAGGNYFSKDGTPLGIFYPRTNTIIISSRASIADQLAALYHELSHFHFERIGNPTYKYDFAEEIRCHSEMFMYYFNELKPFGLYGYETERRFNIIKQFGIHEYMRYRYSFLYQSVYGKETTENKELQNLLNQLDLK